MPRSARHSNTGKRPGSRNKATVETCAAMAGEQPAKEVLANFMHEYSAFAKYYRPALPGEPANPNADEEQFLKWSRLAVQVAIKLIPYQSPKIRSVAYVPPPEPSRPTPERAASKLSPEEAYRLMVRGKPDPTAH